MPEQHESHAWDQMTPQELVAWLPYELYGPVSMFGTQLDLLASGAFEDDEQLADIVQHLREASNHLSMLVVALKRYSAQLPAVAPPHEQA